MQGDLFNQPEAEPQKIVGAADKARYELSKEAKQKRAETRARNAQRAEDAEAKRQDQIDRALEQGVDLRTEDDFRSNNAKYFAGKAKEELRKAPPPPDASID